MNIKLGLAISSLLFVLLPFTSVTVNGREQPNLTSGMDLLWKFFGPIRDYYQLYIVDPSARSQTIRRLSELSEELDELAIAKQKLTNELLSEFDSAQQRVEPDSSRIERLRNTALSLRTAVQDVSNSLRRVFEPLPYNLRKQGRDIQRTIEQGLTGKWQNLQDIFDELQVSEPSAKALREESTEMLNSINRVREEVDALIEMLAATRTDSDQDTTDET